MHRPRLAGITLVIASLLTGSAMSACGGDDDDTLSKEEFVKQANAICKRHREQVVAAATKVLSGGNLPSERRFARLARTTIVPEYSAAIRELRALKPPDDLADDFRRWLADSDAMLARMRRNPGIITRAANFARVNGESDRLGLSQSCHVGPG